MIPGQKKNCVYKKKRQLLSLSTMNFLVQNPISFISSFGKIASFVNKQLGIFVGKEKKNLQIICSCGIQTSFSQIMDTSLCLFFHFYWNIVNLQFCVPRVYQSESFILISTLFQILSPYKPLQSIDQNRLCYRADSYQLPIQRCVCQSPSPSLYLATIPWLPQLVF